MTAPPEQAPAGADARRRRAADLQILLKFYARKAQAGREPNDRARARGVKALTRRMRPAELDALLRDGDDDCR